MNSTRDKSVKIEQNDKKIMDELQAQLDIAVFEQEEMDADKVKEILEKMENISSDEDKKSFDKELLWKKIEEQSREEFAEEQMAEFDRIREDKSVKKSKTHGKPATTIALTAVTIAIAIFIGANIGTYATEKKSVFEYVGELSNGTSFWVTGDTPNMDVEKEQTIFYSWNDVPNEYKEFLVIPRGLPEDMGLYDIKINENNTVKEVGIRYISGDGKQDFCILVKANMNEEFTIGNLMYEDKYTSMSEQQIDGVVVNIYCDMNDEIVAQYIYNNNIYTVSSTLDVNVIISVIEQMIE